MIATATTHESDRPTRGSARTPRLSDTSLRYMSALYDPRSVGEGAWVPHQTGMSQKTRVYCRGSMATGTTGYGFITVAPSLGVANDLNPIVYTVSGSVWNPSTSISSATGTAGSGLVTNAPYNSSLMSPSTSPGLQYKIVGCAIYVKYADTELNRGGDMVLIEEINHRSLAQYSYTAALGQDYSKRVSVSNDWQRVCFTPNSDAEAEFAPSPNGGSLSNPFLGIIVNSASASRAFDFEVNWVVEYLGQQARAPSISFEDPIGYRAVTGAADQFMQLDSVLGLDGFIRSVEEQLLNFSGVGSTSTHQQNWAGLLPFLPHLASLAPLAIKAVKTAVKAVSSGSSISEAAKIAAAKTLRRAVAPNAHLRIKSK